MHIKQIYQAVKIKEKNPNHADSLSFMNVHDNLIMRDWRKSSY